MKKWILTHSKLFAIMLLFAVMVASFASAAISGAFAWGGCTRWYACPISQYFGHYQEHGVDLLTHGLVITALASGTVTYDRPQCWSGECVQDITWRLDRPACHYGRCEPYAYVQIRYMSTFVHRGQHVGVGTALGYSSGFMEFGLTPDWAYGVSNWRWGIDPRFLL